MAGKGKNGVTKYRDFWRSKMDIDARIVDGHVQVYRRSGGHVLGTLGKANPIKVASNGGVIAMLYADGTIERYSAHTRVFLGAITLHGAMALEMTVDALYVIHRVGSGAGLRCYAPATGRQISHRLAKATANSRPTAIRKIRELASPRARRVA
jgi:hypothetical protein